jgi:TPR repeat protein
MMAIERGNKDAMNNLGVVFYNEGNSKEAKRYYMMAIERGQSDAMKNIKLIPGWENINTKEVN